MTPLDIVNVLTAAAPIVASVASIASTPEPTVIRKETPTVTNNISVTVNNHFYTNSEREAMITAMQMQNEIIGTITSGTRYML